MTQPIFHEWQNRTLDDAIYECRELFEDTTFPTVQRWHERGGKIVGLFQVVFPEEIVHAAGLLPFKVRGAPIEASRQTRALDRTSARFSRLLLNWRSATLSRSKCS